MTLVPGVLDKRFEKRKIFGTQQAFADSHGLEQAGPLNRGLSGGRVLLVREGGDESHGRPRYPVGEPEESYRRQSIHLRDSDCRSPRCS